MNEPSQVIVAESRSRQDVTPISAGAITPMQMLKIAVQQGADLDKLQQLMNLQERWEANEARKAYVAAMATFKKTPPEIIKGKHVSFENRVGTITEYNHATLAAVCEAIIAGLSAVGISHRWKTEQPNGLIRVTCVLTHEAGHCEETTLEAGADDSGGKNRIQSIGSAVSYLQRYTLLAATGLATREQDDDGRDAEVILTIGPGQEKELTELITKLGGNLAKLLTYWKIGSLSEILVTNYEAACRDVRTFAEARARARAECSK